MKQTGAGCCVISWDFDQESATLQEARIVGKVNNRNFDELRHTDEIFLDVAETFDAVSMEGLLFKPTVLNFPSYLEKPYHHALTSEHSKRPSSELGWPRVDSSLPCCCLNVNLIPTPSRRHELALYAEDTALVAMSKSPTLFAPYLETDLGGLELWLRT
jgi:hypothetical protein